MWKVDLSKGKESENVAHCKGRSHVTAKQPGDRQQGRDCWGKWKQVAPGTWGRSQSNWRLLKERINQDSPERADQHSVCVYLFIVTPLSTFSGSSCL